MEEGRISPELGRIGLRQQHNMSRLSFSKDLNGERVSTDGQSESVSAASAAGASLVLDLVLDAVNILVYCVSVDSITVVVKSVSMPVVAIPVSICNMAVDERAVLVFTELADEFRLQS